MNRLFNLLLRNKPEREKPRDIEYPCGKVTLMLPSDHALPKFQKDHPRYDRFLPHLATFIPSNFSVIDVGANCGDTVAAMLQANSTVRYFCIEPDQDFLRYFRHNLTRIRSAFPNAWVEIHEGLVGKLVTSADLTGQGGTKHAEPSAGGKRTVTLDDIFKTKAHPQLGLLKSDVDGYDFDVLDSAAALIKSETPALFFECQYSTSEQLQGFQGTIARLFEEGYCHWTVFDNFGEVVLHNASQCTIFQLFTYVWRQNQKLSTRTIYYFDLLACTDRHATWIQESVESYQLLRNSA